MSERRVNIVGVGNSLMGDDGVGPAVIERLGRRGTTDGVVLHDAGLAVSDVLGLLDPSDPLIVIDAVRAGGRPGQVHRFRLNVFDLDGEPLAGAVSLHELSVVPALGIEVLTGRIFGDVTVFGVEPGVVAWGEGLSPAVADAVEHLVDEILAHLKNGPAPEPAAEAAGGSPRRDVS